MKTKDFFNFLGCCVIAVAIVISGYMISNKIAQIPKFPNSLSVSTQDSSQQYGDYLTVYEAAAYLGVSDTDVNNLINSGKLDSAICKSVKAILLAKNTCRNG